MDKGTNMETIGIIAAMTQEREAVLRLVQGAERSLLGPFRCDRFHLAGRDCGLVTSGMGPRRAAQAASTLIEAIHPGLLVSVGIAGAVNADLEIGDVVAARNTCVLDQGLAGPFQTLARLSEAAWQASAQALLAGGARLVSGTAVTTRGSQFIQSQPDGMANPVLEMETAGIAQAAAQQGIPLLCLRAISDGPRSPIPFDLEAMMDEDYNLRISKIIKTITGHPQMIPQLVRMGRNTAKAAENAAIALIAVLSQPDVLLLQR
jgi:adenosylhomocysteine nucleosidase